MRVSRGPALKSKKSVGPASLRWKLPVALHTLGLGEMMGMDNSYFPVEPWLLEALGCCRNYRG